MERCCIAATLKIKKMDKLKIINGIDEELPSGCKYGNGRLYPLEKVNHDRFPKTRIDRVRYLPNGQNEIFGDDEVTEFKDMLASDFDLVKLAENGVDLKEMSVVSGSPLNDTFKLENALNKEMNNPKNFENNDEN